VSAVDKESRYVKESEREVVLDTVTN